MNLKHKLVALFISLTSLIWTSSAIALDGLDIYGKKHTFPSNQWVIINYWATWCHYCLSEIPTLNKVMAATKDRPVLVLAVNYDEASDREQQQFAADHHVNFLLMHSNPYESSIPTSMITTLPTTFVISPEGQVRQLDGEQSFGNLMRAIGA